MKKTANKAVIGYRVDPTQANTAEVAETLGITEDELHIVVAYVDLLAKRLEAAPIAPITAEGETYLRKRFPNNDKAQAEYDQVKIVDNAAKFVEDAAFGFPVGNLTKPAPIPKAKKDVEMASMRVMASQADEDREVSLAKALRWLAQMRVQQAYKDAIGPIFQLVHHERRGYDWAAIEQTENAVAPDESLKTLMA